MAIVKWEPLDLRSFWRWPSVWEDEEMMPMMDSRALDIYETKNEVVVKANIAGVKPEKVDITFGKGVLWIRAEEQEEEKEDRKYYRKFSRSYSYKVAVPGNVDMKAEPKAEVDEGVVTVTFKKSEGAKPRRIPVKARSK